MNKESILIAIFILSFVSFAIVTNAYTIQDFANYVSQLFSSGNQTNVTTGGFNFLSWIQSLFKPKTLQYSCCDAAGMPCQCDESADCVYSCPSPCDVCNPNSNCYDKCQCNPSDPSCNNQQCSCAGVICGSRDNCGNYCYPGSSGCTPQEQPCDCTSVHCGTTIPGCSPCVVGSGCQQSCGDKGGTSCPSSGCQGQTDVGPTWDCSHCCLGNPQNPPTGKPDCPYGCCVNDPTYKDKSCSSGQCDASTHTCSINYCQDNGNGNNPFTGGTCTDRTGSHPDACSASGSGLTKWYCQNNLCTSTTYGCNSYCIGLGYISGSCISPGQCQCKTGTTTPPGGAQCDTTCGAPPATGCNPCGTQYYCGKLSKCYADQTSCQSACGTTKPSCTPSGQCYGSESGCQYYCQVLGYNYQYSTGYDCSVGGCCFCTSKVACTSQTEKTDCAGYNSADGCKIGKCVNNVCQSSSASSGTKCTSNGVSGQCDANGKCVTQVTQNCPSLYYGGTCPSNCIGTCFCQCSGSSSYIKPGSTCCSSPPTNCPNNYFSDQNCGGTCVKNTQQCVAAKNYQGCYSCVSAVTSPSPSQCYCRWYQQDPIFGNKNMCKILDISSCTSILTKGKCGTPCTLQGAIIGQSLDSSGNPILGATISVVSQTGDVVKTVTSGSDGIYTITDLDEGSYTIRVVANDYSYTAQSVNVQGDATVKANVELKKTFTTEKSAQGTYTTSLNVQSTDSMWILLGSPLENKVLVSDSPEKVTYSTISQGTLTLITFIFQPKFAVYSTQVNLQ